MQSINKPKPTLNTRSNTGLKTRRNAGVMSLITPSGCLSAMHNRSPQKPGPSTRRVNFYGGSFTPRSTPGPQAATSIHLFIYGFPRFYLRPREIRSSPYYRNRRQTRRHARRTRTARALQSQTSSDPHRRGPRRALTPDPCFRHHSHARRRRQDDDHHRLSRCTHPPREKSGRRPARAFTRPRFRT